MPPTAGIPAIQQLQGSVVDGSGQFTVPAYQYFAQENAILLTILQVVNGVPGVNSFTLATQPALSPADAGYVGYVSDYGHLVQWDGASWFFLDSCGGFFQDFAVAPQGNGWHKSDGTVTSYLTVGATLTATAFTTPNLSANPAYRKSGAYTGSIDAAVAPGATTVMSGSTAAGVTGTGTTAADSSGIANDTKTDPLGFSTNLFTHVHGIPALTIPALGVGTIDAAVTVDATGEPQSLTATVFFRR